MPKKIISYALFGYGKGRRPNCFEFGDYLRGVATNIRFARLLYPDWIIRVHVDRDTDIGCGKILRDLGIEVVVCPDAPLTKAMLWRLMPCFDTEVEYTICRDLDSPLTFREAQAVHQFIESGKAAHAINDSVSHNIPMMGGMIGFWKYIRDYTGFQTWNEMVESKKGIDYNNKGADQFFLCNYIYPKFASTDNHSIMHHYFLGYRPTEINASTLTCSCRQDDSTHHKQGCKLDIDLPGVSDELRGTNDVCGHIGAAGAYTTVMNRFMHQYRELFSDLEVIERRYPDIFTWVNDAAFN